MSRGQSRARAVPSTAALLAALSLAGCAGTAAFDGTDPIKGGPPIQKRTSPAPSLVAGLSSTPPASVPQTPAGQLPPLPTPSQATSPAALAGGQAQPLDNSRELRIGVPTPVAPDQPLWRGTDGAATAGARQSDPPGSAPVTPASGPLPPAPVAVQQSTGVTLTGVQAAVGSQLTPSPQTAAVVFPGSVAQADSLDQAFKQLHTGRQVTWERLQTSNSGCEFQCYIANPTRADSEFQYKAEGVTELEAVRKVLDQIALEKH